LKKFVETINGRDGTGSHLVTIPPGPHLSDALISSPIIQEDESSNAVVSNGSGGFQLDFDPNDDPELALALRVSMEENRARLAQDEKTENDANELQPNMRSEDSSNALSTSNDQKVENIGLDISVSEDPELALAIRMSMETSEIENKQTEKGKKSVLESLPGVDPQSEAMRQAMGALTGSAKKEDKDEKKSDDKDKK